MRDDIALLPSARKRAKGVGPRDVRRIGDPTSPTGHTPPALTQPGEPWHLNGYNLTQVIVVREREGDDPYHVLIGSFTTARDAVCAMHGHNALSLIIDAYGIARTPEDFYDRVIEILRIFGRLPNDQ